MNSTNRFANRLLLVVVGLITLALGAAAVGVGTIVPLVEGWDEIAPVALTTVETWLKATPVTQNGPSWILVGILVVLILAIVVLIVFIFRQGRGRTNRLIVARSGDSGTTIVETAVAADILHEALSRHPELISSHVSAYRVRGRPVIDVAVTCRRGTSPRAVGDTVDNSLRELSALLGAEIPALVQIGGGLRTRLAAPQRLAPPEIVDARPRQLAHHS